MRKLKLQMQTSLEGFVSTGPNDEQKWVTWAWDEIRDYVLNLMDSSDTIVIGRKLAVDYIPHWQEVVGNPKDPLHEVATRVTGAKKVVFTKTLANSEWNNTVLAKGNLTDEINRLKAQPGKDIMVYGGSSFAAALVRENLIDEYHLFINPIALGQGEPIFGLLPQPLRLTLKNSVTCKSGIVILNYEPNSTGI